MENILHNDRLHNWKKKTTSLAQGTLRKAWNWQVKTIRCKLIWKHDARETTTRHDRTQYEILFTPIQHKFRWFLTKNWRLLKPTTRDGTEQAFNPHTLSSQNNEHSNQTFTEPHIHFRRRTNKNEANLWPPVTGDRSALSPRHLNSPTGTRIGDIAPLQKCDVTHRFAPGSPFLGQLRIIRRRRGAPCENGNHPRLKINCTRPTRISSAWKGAYADGTMRRLVKISGDLFERNTRSRLSCQLCDGKSRDGMIIVCSRKRSLGFELVMPSLNRVSVWCSKGYVFFL